MFLRVAATAAIPADRKSTRLNSSHLGTSYAVFCLKKGKDAAESERQATGPLAIPACVLGGAGEPSCCYVKSPGYSFGGSAFQTTFDLFFQYSATPKHHPFPPTVALPP